MNATTKSHWDHIYATKTPDQVSWTQPVPSTSLEMIAQSGVSKSDAIIDIGGGDSQLADFLLNEGYTDITVLDISEKAIGRAKLRLGVKAAKVKWIVSDILDFKPERKYDLWHDRAAFHFLTEERDIQQYIQLASSTTTKNMVLGTFSVDGPIKCSGLPIHQYHEDDMKELFNRFGFTSTGCKRVNHTTPSGNIQNFVFCGFER